MSETIISIRNLGKCYNIEHESGLKSASYKRLNEELGDLLIGPFRKFLPEKAAPRIDVEKFWALKNFSLDIGKGERVGLIGRNGAGKSTLLKLLSRITMPTTGSLEIRGRLASLLEVGTGFHPELTGRENIFLNGSILGLKRYQIQRRYDAIVEFSGVEKFLDTPVKRYSSGMQVRLAFAVAAHLDPEIMLVDEVLAVGDARFQKKCIGKMNEVARTSERTILFVSHTMAFVESLCNRAVWLDNGELKADSNDVQQIVHDYLETTVDKAQLNAEWRNSGNDIENEFFRPLMMRLKGGRSVVPNNAPIEVEVEIDLKMVDPRLKIGIALFTDENQLIFVSYNTDVNPELASQMEPGTRTLKCTLPPHLLNEQTHRVELSAQLHQGSNLTELGTCPASFKFEVRGGLSNSTYWTSRRPGLVAPIIDWSSI